MHGVFRQIPKRRKLILMWSLDMTEILAATLESHQTD
jgi:hypothetical protein